MAMTRAQEEFLREIKPHVDYRTIGRKMATAKRLEHAGYVKIVQGYFAYLTPAGQSFLGRRARALLSDGGET